MPNESKTSAVEELTHVLKDARSIYLTDFTGMPVEMMSALRRRCREADVEYRVVKGTLTKLAAKRAGVGQVADYIEGPTALAMAHTDELAPARVLTEFAREYKLPRIRAALVEGRIFDEEGIKALAVLPAREILIGQLLSGIIAPIGTLTGMLHRMIWKLVATMDALASSMKEQSAEQTEAGISPAHSGDDETAAHSGESETPAPAEEQ